MTIPDLAQREIRRRTSGATGFGGGPAIPTNVSVEDEPRSPAVNVPSEPTGSVQQWWSKNALNDYVALNPEQRAFNVLDPRFDAGDITDWDQAAIDRILSSLQASLGAILETDVPDSVAYLQAVYLAEGQLRAAGVNGNQIAGLVNETKNTVQPLAQSRGMFLEDFGSAFLEDNDPQNRLKIDDHQLVPPNLAINIGGLSPGNYAEQLEAQIPRWPGTGSTAPKYVRPDRDLVREIVRGKLQTLTGNVDEGNLEALTDKWMMKHREDFDRPEQQVDPTTAVVEDIRKQSDYLRSHRFRPEDVDESQWLTSAIANARGTGLQEDVARVRGQEVAAVGTTQSTNQGFATQRSGQLDGNFFNQVANATQSLGRAFR